MPHMLQLKPQQTLAICNIPIKPTNEYIWRRATSRQFNGRLFLVKCTQHRPTLIAGANINATSSQIHPYEHLLLCETKANHVNGRMHAV